MRLLDKYTEDGYLQYTTDPLVMYDHGVESFHVLLPGSWAEVYGWDRMHLAEQIADAFRAGHIEVKRPPGEG